MPRASLDPASLLDLSPDRRASVLTEAALEASHVARLRLGAAPLVAPLEPEARAAFEYLLDQVARLSAEVETLAQAQEAARRSREARLSLDPVRAIPEERVAAALGTASSAPPDAFALEAGAPDFNGTGWHEGEPVPGGSLRWSGTGRCASILLPAMGGRLRVSLSVRTPFHQPLDPAEHEVFLDGLPLALRRIRGDAVAGVFEAEAVLPEAGLGTRHLLLIHGRQWQDPAPGPRRDTRRLGLGLHWLRVERAEAGEA